MSDFDDYEEYHETRQSILQSEDEPPPCPIGDLVGCKFLHLDKAWYEWGCQLDYECQHPEGDGINCPLTEDEG